MPGPEDDKTQLTQLAQNTPPKQPSVGIGQPPPIRDQLKASTEASTRVFKEGLGSPAVLAITSPAFREAITSYLNRFPEGAAATIDQNGRSQSTIQKLQEIGNAIGQIKDPNMRTVKTAQIRARLDGALTPFRSKPATDKINFGDVLAAVDSQYNPCKDLAAKPPTAAEIQAAREALTPEKMTLGQLKGKKQETGFELPADRQKIEARLQTIEKLPQAGQLVAYKEIFDEVQKRTDRVFAQRRGTQIEASVANVYDLTQNKKSQDFVGEAKKATVDGNFTAAITAYKNAVASHPFINLEVRETFRESLGKK